MIRGTSYRSQDRLAAEAAHVSVFVDTESINPSERWPDRLTAALDHLGVVALIGPNWRFGADGTDRFARPQGLGAPGVGARARTQGSARPRLLRQHCRDGLPRSAPEPDRPAPHPGTQADSETWLPSVDRLGLQWRVLGRVPSKERSSFRIRTNLKSAHLGPPKPNSTSTSSPWTASPSGYFRPFLRQHSQRRGRGHRDLPAVSPSLTSSVRSPSWHAVPNWPRACVITLIGRTSGIVSMCGYPPSMLTSRLRGTTSRWPATCTRPPCRSAMRKDRLGLSGLSCDVKCRPNLADDGPWGDVWVRSGVSRLSTVGHLLGPDSACQDGSHQLSRKEHPGPRWNPGRPGGQPGSVDLQNPKHNLQTADSPRQPQVSPGVNHRG